MLLPKLGGFWLLPPRDFPHLSESHPMDHDSDSSGHAKIQDLTLCPFGADQRPTPNEKKTGTRYRKITDCARRKKGERRKFFSREMSVLLDLPANG